MRRLSIPHRHRASPGGVDKSNGRYVHYDTYEEKQKWNAAYDKVQVPLVAQWSNLRILARELASLKEGDIIPLNPKRLNQVEVQLEGTTKFIGRLGSLDQKAAVQLKERFKA